VTLLFTLIVVASYALYVTKPEERERALRAIDQRLWHVRAAVDKVRLRDEPFRTALATRIRFAIATPAIIGLCALVFVGIAAGSGSFGAADTLIGWGASFGPRTTNGEWWRLVTALFVPAGFFHLVITSIALAQSGITLERLLGPAAVAVTFVSAGVLANVQHVSSYPLGIAAGASAGVFGIYGLLAATVMWGILAGRSGELVALGNIRGGAAASISPSALASQAADADTHAGDAAAEPAMPGSLTIPLPTLSRMAPVFFLFVLYNIAAGTLDAAALTGALAGFIAGLVFARDAAERTTNPVHAAAALGVTAVIVIASAALLHGIADVRPEIARVVALEDQTAGVYEKAVEQFRNGALSARSLAKLINQKIVPELQAAQTRLKSVQGVPAEHQPLVASADEYFRLRGESWRLRADALDKSNMKALRAADRSERASLEALERIRPPADAAGDAPVSR